MNKIHLSQIHTFHFSPFQTIKKNKDVENNLIQWTNRIDFFQKRIIFILIHHCIYWSLYVVINPGKIRNNKMMC